MAKSDEMGGDYLLGTYEALGLAAPDLQHHITTLLRRGPVSDAPPAMGESIHPQYRMDMRAEDAAAILDSLRQLEQKVGYDRTFNERQVNLLAVTWHHQVERLRASAP